jgi:hypothetical protein
MQNDGVLTNVVQAQILFQNDVFGEGVTDRQQSRFGRAGFSETAFAC